MLETNFKIIVIVIATTVLLLLPSSCADNSSTQNPTPESQHHIKLVPAAGKQIYFSAFPDFGEDENDVSVKRIREFEELAKKRIAIAPFSQYWFEGIKYPKKNIHIIHDAGVIPLIRMQPRSTTTEYLKENVFTLENIIKGKFDDRLEQYARDAKADNIPILIDFAVEMNGKWFPWNGFWNGGGITDNYGDPNYPDGPERYRDAYRHIIDIFRREKANKITWFFHPTMYTQEPNEDWNNPKWYYPGDDYIDWIGVSIYGPLFPKQDYWDSFDEVLESDNAYKKILEISSQKPFAILEMGVTDFHPLGKKDKWLKEAFKSILDNKYIDFRLLTYWNENWDNDGSQTSLKIDSSEAVLDVFQKAVKDPRFVSKAVFEELP